MKTLLNVLVLLYVGTRLTACGPVLYSNVGQNVPLLQEKGDLGGQIAYSGSYGAWDAEGIGIQGAYALTEKVGIISSFYSLSEVDDPNNEWEGKGSYFEVGSGLFGGNPQKKLMYEGYVGLGVGSIKNQSLVTTGEYINVKFVKPFIQPSVGFATKYFDLALTPRIAYLNYTSRNDFWFDPNSAPNTPGDFFDQNGSRLLFEPGILLRGGFPGAKLELQYNFSSIKEKSENYFVNNEDYFSIGIRFLIAERTKGKEKK